MKKDILTKIVKLWYIIIQILILFILPYLVTFVFDIQKISDFWQTFTGNEFKISGSKIGIALVAFIIIFLGLRKYNSKRTFLSGNDYGSYSKCTYFVVNILGYKIELERKPYDKIFWFLLGPQIWNLTKQNYEKNIEKLAEIDRTNFNFSTNMRESNLMIADTYPITIDQLPDEKRKFDTIIVSRKKASSGELRIESVDLIEKVSEMFAILQETGSIINLYLTTNVINTERIIKDILKKGGRSKYDIRLHLQEKDGERKFKSESIKIKIG
jgi:hypothetical protein